MTLLRRLAQNVRARFLSAESESRKQVGADVQRPLAIVVVYGLLTSTLLTLFVLPAIYVWVEERVERRRA